VNLRDHPLDAPMLSESTNPTNGFPKNARRCPEKCKSFVQKVRNFLHDHVDPGVFAPDAVRTLIAAFDDAWQSIIASGAKLSGQQSELTRELLAKYIIEQARQGELDECRLRDGALLHLAQSNLRRPPSHRK
jgi:hypothetical protein